jgi:hypothetical protein
VRPEVVEGSLKKGQVCVCKYSAEPGKWFRGKVLEVLEKEGQVQILYLDYGNSDTVSAEEVVLASPSSFLFQLPPQAVECSLAFLSVLPLDTDLGREAAHSLNDLVWDRDLLLQVIGQPDVGAPLPVALYEPGSEPLSLDHVTKYSGDPDDQPRSVNEQLILQVISPFSS